MIPHLLSKISYAILYDYWVVKKTIAPCPAYYQLLFSTSFLKERKNTFLTFYILFYNRISKQFHQKIFVRTFLQLNFDPVVSINS